MVADLIGIFRARRDPALAARLAARLAQGQLLDRLSAPLWIVSFGLWAVAVVCALLVCGALFAAVTLHWTAAIPAVLPLGLGVLAIFIARGLSRGMESVRERANALTDTLTDAGVDRIRALTAETAPADMPQG